MIAVPCASAQAPPAPLTSGADEIGSVSQLDGTVLWGVQPESGVRRRVKPPTGGPTALPIAALGDNSEGGADLGTDAESKLVATYSRCRHKRCRIFAYRFADATEQLVPGIHQPGG